MPTIKPTGAIGPIKVETSPSGAVATWEKIAFPTSKPEIEQLIIDLFINTFKANGATFLKVQQNDENDFDYMLTIPGWCVYLDLCEFIYFDGQGKPYSEHASKLYSFLLAEQLTDAVIKKSNHYGKSGETPIHLLLYITHWRFLYSEVAIRLAQHFLKNENIVFENVFLLIPIDGKSGELRALFPSIDPLEGHAPSEYNEHFFVNFGPDKFEMRQVNGAVQLSEKIDIA
jgi:hypothetical protein